MLHVISWSLEYIMFCFVTTCHFGFCCSFVRNKLCQILQEMAEPFCTLFVYFIHFWLHLDLKQGCMKFPDSLLTNSRLTLHLQHMGLLFTVPCWTQETLSPGSVDAHSPLSPPLITESVKQSSILFICNQAAPQPSCFAFSCSQALSRINWEI